MSWTNKQAEDFNLLLRQFVASEVIENLKERQDHTRPIPDSIVSPIAREAFQLMDRSDTLSDAFTECIDIAIDHYFELKGETQNG